MSEELSDMGSGEEWEQIKYTHVMYMPTLLPDFCLRWLTGKTVALLINIKKIRQYISYLSTHVYVSTGQQDSNTQQEADHYSLKLDMEVSRLCSGRKNGTSSVKFRCSVH